MFLLHNNKSLVCFLVGNWSQFEKFPEGNRQHREVTLKAIVGLLDLDDRSQ